jgi:hypothetical protein
MSTTARQPRTPFPPCHQDKPELDLELEPKPRYEALRYKGSGKLEGKVALVHRRRFGDRTGG